MLSPNETQHYAAELILRVGALSTRDALHVLTEVMEQILVRSTSSTNGAGDELQTAVFAVNPNLIRRQRESRIESDAALKAFIHGLRGYHTGLQIVNACREHFGASRAPSLSAVHRYLDTLKFPNGNPHSKPRVRAKLKESKR